MDILYDATDIAQSTPLEVDRLRYRTNQASWLPPGPFFTFTMDCVKRTLLRVVVFFRMGDLEQADLGAREAEGIFRLLTGRNVDDGRRDGRRDGRHNVPVILVAKRRYSLDTRPRRASAKLGPIGKETPGFCALDAGPERCGRARCTAGRVLRAAKCCGVDIGRQAATMA